MDVSIDGDGHYVEQGTHTGDVTDSRYECTESWLQFKPFLPMYDAYS